VIKFLFTIHKYGIEGRHSVYWRSVKKRHIFLT